METVTEIKPWQKGFAIEEINTIKKAFKPYNDRALSPFSQWNGPTIATSLEKKRLIPLGDPALGNLAYIDTNIVKSKGSIVMYNDIIIGEKIKGDRVINAVTGGSQPMETIIREINSFTEPTWFFIWEEDIWQKDLAIICNFKKIGVKITAFAEIYGIYFRDSQASTIDGSVNERVHPKIDKSEYACLLDLKLNLKELAESIATKLPAFEDQFKNHYSNYNKGQSWGAISVRGYSPDITMIEKPDSMPAAWQEEHKNDVFELQDTELRAKFPEIEEILKQFPTETFDRIRFMKLMPGGGELSRHVDRGDAGMNDGSVMRFHVPIITNPGVIFTMWNTEGEELNKNLKVGEAWLFDFRKPHKAVNNGSEIRIHLVIDIFMDKKMRDFVASKL